MAGHSEPFIGSEALADGALNRHRLRTLYRAEFPGVYAARRTSLTFRQRTVAAWLWSGRQAVVAGSAAAGLHGTLWIDDDTPVELVHSNPRAPRGIITRRDTLLDNEIRILRLPAWDVTVTTPARTAFDIGRRGNLRSTISRLDALGQATGFTADEVFAVAQSHPRTRGLRRLEQALGLFDAGAESPRETYLRLLLIDAGFPRPRTQIPVVTKRRTYRLDMGWEDIMVAAEYDGDRHFTDRPRYVHDIARAEALVEAGWLVTRVVAEHRPDDIVRRVQASWDARRLSVR